MTRDYAHSLLESVFGEKSVLPEWDVAKNSEDAMRNRLRYCPRIDFAIKPLNIDNNIEHNNRLIDPKYRNYRDLVNTLKRSGLTNSRWTENRNPRCFLAIELENKTSTKHKLGSLINASAMGKVGIIIAMNPKVYRSYGRILNYLEFLQHRKRFEEMQNNFLVLPWDDFESILKEYAEGSEQECLNR